MTRQVSSSTSVSMGKVAAASFIGTTIEWYDFQLYGLGAAVIFNKLFFPNVSPLAGTLASFSVFAIGFVARPIGGILFGHFGDRVGRKSILLTTLLLMGTTTFLVGLLPTYSMVGVAAPLLLVLLRLLGGIGLGGEWGGAVLVSVEHARENDRIPLLELLRTNPKGVLLGIDAFVVTSGGYYVYATYMVSYGTRTLGMSTTTMLIGGIVFSAFGLIASPTFSALSDRVGRRPVFIGAAAFTALYAFPLFWLVDTRISVVIWLALAIGGLANGALYGLMGSLASEMFSTRVRSDVLRRLAPHYRLATISNSQDDIITHSVARLGGPFSWVLTAERTRAYKPDPALFELVLRESGVPAGRTVHVAQSQYVDLPRSVPMGMRTVWVNRNGQRLRPGTPEPHAELPDLRGLPGLLQLA